MEYQSTRKAFKRKAKKWLQNTCSVKTVKKRVPVTEWLPKYKSKYIVHDVIAGATVALTAIPQGIAFAVIAGLPPEHGLYSSLTSGIVYMVFGSCYNLTVGPTAILAAMTAKYVKDYSADFDTLAAFVSGVIILLTGLLNLGFLIEFISMPVISAFTTAAALQISSGQLKSFFGLQGSSGNNFAESMYNFVINIKTIKLWDTVLSFATVIMLIILKKMGEGSKNSAGVLMKIIWFISLSKNAVVVIFGMIFAYTMKQAFATEPFALVGEIGSGLPKFGLPPFSTTVGNVTYNFVDMIQILGIQSIVIPFVAILEAVAIAKAFAEGGRIDAKQEMIAVGLCNIVGSCAQSMPITGSFARTALNHVSGVKTPAGGVTKVLLLVVALTSLTSTFYYIPKASLGSLIITALFSIMDFHIIHRLWRNTKKELLVYLVTMFICLTWGLEYGVLAGMVFDAMLLLFNSARPPIQITKIKSDMGDMIMITLSADLSYCGTGYFRQEIMKVTSDVGNLMPIVINGEKIIKIDYTAGYNFVNIIKDMDKINNVLLQNFSEKSKKLCTDMEPTLQSKFVCGLSSTELTIAMIPKIV